MDTRPANDFDDVLAKIRRECTDKRDLGARFEKITKGFLKTDKLYANRFSRVWLWKEWPKNDGADTGIDLVAEEWRDGSLCAIQCKCYADDGSISMKAVSTFLAKAASLGIKNKILVYTGERATGHAMKVLEDSKCQILSQSGFRDSSVDWSNYPTLARKNPKSLRKHQVSAMDDVLEGIKSKDRGKLIMACGTGKTLTSLHVAERYSGTGKIVLYLVPSISLILQTMREWSENANMKHNYIVVCSDKSTGEDGSITELESPVSTDVETLKNSLKKIPKDSLTAVFSTYHSLPVVKKAAGKLKFDIIFCDEAHRTTGVEDKSFFTLVHEDSNVKAGKRVYMTATPRVYSDVIKAKMGKVIYSMDDESKYGPVFHNFSFSDAVRQGVLSDFRVKIAIVPSEVADRDFIQSISEKSGEIPLDERTLLASVWHGLNHPDDDESPKLLQRVIAFTNRIDRSLMFAGKITDNNDTNRSLDTIVNALEPKWKTGNRVEVEHVDGKTRAIERRNQVHWLDESTTDPNTCRIISNAKCLSEGVDVPALDGVIFLNPRKSKVDVVQSVGRVMRKSPGKAYGYVILPVALPPGKAYHEALDDNKTFKVVWQVLNALRSHDENFANEINQLILDRNTENTAPTKRISVSILEGDYTEEKPRSEFFAKIKSKLVEKVGDIDYYDKYGQKLGRAAGNIEHIIKGRMDDPDVSGEIMRLHEGLKEIINDSVTVEETVRIIAQHMVLSRVFDSLFQGEFASHNPVSTTLGDVVRKLRLDAELESLSGFYEDVEWELEAITTREARQNFIKKIYENFFKSIAKKETEQHGIVYTPVVIIDFILNSVQDVLRDEFWTEFADRQVKILDPFTGTGTFISRLLESGMLGESIYEKYKHDLYANEMILLAYYVATVNIETTYSSLRQGNRYVPFDGINYTDTLRLNPRWREGVQYRRSGTKLDEAFRDAHKRIQHQRGSHLHVIIGNPPYSVGQKNANDNNPNMKYPELDKRIENTYKTKTKTVRVTSLYDSYVRSIRWASDRIGHSGIIGFVTNASFIRSDTTAGIRACLQKEFTDVWVFDLRGNQRTQGEISKKEGGKVFGSGSRSPVAITILVKNPKKNRCTIHYKDIGDYHSREEKLVFIKKVVSINGIADWKEIEPDDHYDWVEQRNDNFSAYLPIGTKDVKAGKSERSIFQIFSLGVSTNRDVWVYNSSKKKLVENMNIHINYANDQKDPSNPITNPKKAKFTRGLKNKLRKSKSLFDKNKIRISLYRPFFKQYLYFDKSRFYNEDIHLFLKFFPQADSQNLIICYGNRPDMGMFGVLITNITTDLGLMTPAPVQCFSQYIYENNKRKENITNYTLHNYQTHYEDKTITKSDIFYYVYGLLHHHGYRTKYTHNLSKELAHIPMAPDFWTFSRTGKKLADLHLSWETCKRYDLGNPKSEFGKYEKMSFARIKKNGKQVKDITTLKINGIVVFDNIPKTDYQVNGRTPLEWAIDRYKRTVDKESGIVNDATDVDIILLIERLVYVGVESDRLISELPEEFEPKDWKLKKTGLDAHMDLGEPAQSVL